MTVATDRKMTGNISQAGGPVSTPGKYGTSSLLRSTGTGNTWTIPTSSTSTPRAPYCALGVLVLLVGIVQVFPVPVDRSSEEVPYFPGVLTGPPAWLMLPVIFLSVATVMAGVADLVGRCFHGLPRLEAYRLD